ncbi:MULTISPECIES: NIPSNAP family protein [unclassified Nocardia]|uniref:NIPSNAP family protein n=1 Tax=unclassified Nocardia TaxID=2637762 RepID=UPI001CE46CE6|nr:MULTISPECIES: NIPSNAP family protein [unclassified Nocardia]
MTLNQWPLLELRRYTLRPGLRDEMIGLFEREFIESQEELGIRLLGQFRDELDPDLFVWLRAYPDLATRDTALPAFYVDGAAWRANRAAANATMLDSTNALLLRPATTHSALTVPDTRPGRGSTEVPDTRILVTVYYLAGSPEVFTDFFDGWVRPIFDPVDSPPSAAYVTDPSPNSFPQLPNRPDSVFVTFTRFDNRTALDAHLNSLAGSALWTDKVVPELTLWLAAPIERHLLAPTERSLLR